MGCHVQLFRLPEEVIADNIFCYLDLKSLVRVSQTCKRLRNCAYTDGNWKILCQRYWLLTERERSTWREDFIAWYIDLGRYMYVYGPIRRLWDRILGCVRIKSPAIYETLNGPPATEQALDDIEYRLQRPLPKELRCSYRICNGQNLKTSHSRETEYGLLGMLIANNYSVCEVLLSAEGILRNLSQENKRRNAVHFTNRFIYPPGLHSTCNGKPGFSMRVCLKDNGDVRIGNVCIQMDETDAVVPTFVYASNFTEWLEQLACRLESKALMVNEGKISQFNSSSEGPLEMKKVKLDVATVLIPEFSSLVKSNAKLMHAYQITMSMADGILPKYCCTLETRQLEITEHDAESNQRTQEVQGEGVIAGERPNLKPGTKFTFASWTPLTAIEGFMTGKFKFKSNFDQQCFSVPCPKFEFRCPQIKNFKFD
ncbi:F-box only protein 3-like [Apostichopus japonicus]|uniref:F-box only protein 3-like n=1 Tax=Stichopus japonicus TaxID=307972 RepID=UPI003AB22960